MKVAKFVVAALVAALIAVQAAITDGTVTPAEWLAIAVTTLGSFGVYLVPNKPAGPPDAVTAVRERRSGM